MHMGISNVLRDKFTSQRFLTQISTLPGPHWIQNSANSCIYIYIIYICSRIFYGPTSSTFLLHIILNLLGWGGVGHVNVRLHLRHEIDATSRMGLGLGEVGWGMLTFACTCVMKLMLHYALGLGGVGWGMSTFACTCVMKLMLRHAWGWGWVGWGMSTFACTCVMKLMLRHAWGWGWVGWGMSTFACTCVMKLMLRYRWGWGWVGWGGAC